MLNSNENSINGTDKATTIYRKLIQELSMLNMFVEDSRNTENHEITLDLQTKFEKALSLHDSFKEYEYYDRMIDADFTSTEILEIKTKNLLKEFLTYFAQDIIEVIVSDRIDHNLLFHWEREIIWDCFEGKGVLSKYQFSSSIINYCKNITFSNLDETTLVETEKIDSLPKKYSTVVLTKVESEFFDSDQDMLNDLSKKWNMLIQESGYIPKHKYFLNSRNLESVRNLFALFILYDDDLITFTEDLGVKWNGKSVNK